MAGGDEQDNMRDVDGSGGESSDDEIDMVPKTVDNYWLEDGEEQPISFAALPYDEAGRKDATAPKVIFLRGTQDNGMRLYVKALEWKLELAKDGKPVFHVETEKYWIKLLKPRKSYEDIVRSILSVAQFINYAKLNSTHSEKVAWDHVNDAFPSWEVRPSSIDLLSHLTLVRSLMTIDEDLANASALQAIDGGLTKRLVENERQDSQQRILVAHGDEDDADCDKPERNSNNNSEWMDAQTPEPELTMEDLDEDVDAEEVADLSETVCCICDNGGDVICCDGPCMRSFHVNKDAEGADDASCTTLGFTRAEVERMDKFFCPNCKAKKHQCYVCGELGCSDEGAGAAQEVFVCDAAMCGHFYHPKCVAEVILRDKDKSEQASLAESIREQKGFVCPMHKCWKCGKAEVKEDEDLQFGVCRRCPRVWHRKCFPSSIDFDDTDDEPQRAWDDLLPDRILIFCKRHKIIPKLGTPARDHVKFPEGYLPSRKPLVRLKVEGEGQKSKLSKPQVLKKHEADDLSTMREAKIAKKSSTATLQEAKLDITHSKSKMDLDMKSKRGSIMIKGRLDVGKDEAMSKTGATKLEKTISSQQRLAKLSSSKELNVPRVQIFVLDNERRSMIDKIIESTKNSVTIESIQRNHIEPSCYRRSFNKNPDKKHSLTKIESIIKGMRKAVETLEGGGSIEDAKVKCSPALLKYLDACKIELRVYLAPFLYGSRYTSFGRHFTRTEKLEEIVDRLHWYVQPGDMVVDFCCGANEFSLLMKKKLDEVGKKCDYRNFDIIQTKADFNFVKRDWFTVKPSELPNGNRLIMGLNPPFGVKASLANSFIDHALEFKPKLVVLIVPKETERLDQKQEKYDLVWEDLDLLKGQAFYLPGSVDVNENPLIDWNAIPPPLFIWSRPDWTPKHRQIALEQNHVSPNSTTGPPRFAGIPWRRPPQTSSPVIMAEILQEKKNSSVIHESRFAEASDVNVTKAMNRNTWEEFEDLLGSPERKSYKEERVVKRQVKVDKIDKKPEKVAKFEKPERIDKKPLEQRNEKIGNIGKDKDIAKEQGKKVNIKSGEKLAHQWKQVSNNGRRDDKFSKSSESKVHQATASMESHRLDCKKVESLGTLTAKPEVMQVASKQGRGSNGFNISNKNDGLERRRSPYRSPERRRRSLEADRDARSPSSRRERYDASGKKSPDKYDRYGLGDIDKYDKHGGRKSYDKYERHSIDDDRAFADIPRGHNEKRTELYGKRKDSYGDRRVHSPDRSRSKDRMMDKSRPSYRQRSGSQSRSWSPGRGIPRRSEHREEASPDKNKGSSVVDLMSMKNSKDYGRNDNLYGLEGSKRASWAYEEDLYSKRQSGGLNDATYSRDYLDQVAALGGGRQEILGARNGYNIHQTNRPYDGVAFRGATEIGASYMGVLNDGGRTYERSVDLSGYSFSAAASSMLLNTQSSGRSWQDGGIPYGPIPMQSQPSLRLSDPLMLPSHGLFDNRMVHPPPGASQYPAQGRYGGQSTGRFSGGWIED